MPPPCVVIKKQREKSIQFRHPWIFSGALAKEDKVDPGDIVQIRTTGGDVLGWGTYHPASQIRVRVLSFDPNAIVDDDFWRQRLRLAVQRREHLVDQGTNGYRLVMSDADGLPGFVIDRFADWIVVQCLTVGADRYRDIIIDELKTIFQPRGIIDDSKDSVRKKEGLEPRHEVVYGTMPDEPVIIVEEGLKFLTKPGQEQKTGFFFDQRENRKLIRTLSKDAAFLDAFSYSAGFGVAAAMGGAKHVVAIDRSADALELAQANFDMNECSSPLEPICGNAFTVLRDLVDEKRSFSFVNMDPPKFASTGAQVKKATRGYKDVNLLGMKLLNPGGLLATYSCSGHISPELFQKVVFGAAIDADRRFQIVAPLRQATCHPVHLNIPESLYLKGLLLKCLDG